MQKIIDLNNTKVKLIFKSGLEEVKTFQEVSEYALDCKDLKLCADLVTKGFVKVGSVTFILI